MINGSYCDTLCNFCCDGIVVYLTNVKPILLAFVYGNDVSVLMPTLFGKYLVFGFFSGPGLLTWLFCLEFISDKGKTSKYLLLQLTQFIRKFLTFYPILGIL